MARCEEIFRQICWLEERFWPEVDGMGEEDEAAQLNNTGIGSMGPELDNSMNNNGMNNPMMNRTGINNGEGPSVSQGRNSFAHPGGTRLDGVGQE
jgi:hypothetical protein